MTLDDQIAKKIKEIDLLREKRRDLESVIQSDYYMYRRTPVVALSRKLDYRRAFKESERKIEEINAQIQALKMEIDELRKQR